MIYLDYNATAPYSPSVEKYIKEQMASDWANPSSEHDMGFELAGRVKKSRAAIADFLGVSSKSLVFTGSATESINTVLSAENLNARGVKTIVTSKIEHHATLDRVEWLESQGFFVKYIDNDEQGRLDLESLESFLSDCPKVLVSLLFVNNEIGTINPIKEISKVARKHQALVHIDAVQALGKMKFDLDDLDVDYASFAGHKIGAMKGVGLLYSYDIKALTPLMNGGGQERRLRPGTVNYPAIKSLELALSDIDFDKVSEVEKLRNSFEKELLEFSNIGISGIDSLRVGNTSNIFIEGQDARALMLQLGRCGIMVSTGSACSSGSYEPSHVITGLGKSKEHAKSSLRVSLGPKSTEEDIERLLESLKKIVYKL